MSKVKVGEIVYRVADMNGQDFYEQVDYLRAIETGEVVEYPAYDAGAARYFGVSDFGQSRLFTPLPHEAPGILGWPLRLFEVRIMKVGDALGVGHPHKRRDVLAFQVCQEVEACQVFGRHGRELLGLFEQAQRMTPEQRDALKAAFIPGPVYWATLKGVVSEARTTSGLNIAASNAGAFAVRLSGDTTVRDAAYATVLKDFLPQQAYDLLMAPWQSVFGH